MEPLLKQLSEVPRRLAALSRRTIVGLLLVGALVIGAAVAVTSLSSAGEYQYAYTNLTTEDSTEIAAQLKSAGIPHRFEAGGSALSVPSSRVYDVRLLLASAGLPRTGGTGFELFDKGDFGVSEFTQKVNLRRATEGELARTIGRVAGVRSARVHLVLPEKGVFRGEERPASAALMLTLQPGRTLTERELAGLKHLVASAVPTLSPQSVTIVDGRGSVLSSDEGWGAELQGYEKKLEHDLEQRVVSLLEPVVGVGQVVVRVTADVDSAEVTQTQDSFDPDGVVLKTERTVGQNQNQDTAARGGVAGAAANQPDATGQQAVAVAPTNRSTSNSQEESRTYEVSRTSTRTVQRAPRLTRLSVAVLVDGAEGKARGDAEVQRLGELARRAVGFDQARGDQLDISSVVFTHASAEEPVALPVVASNIPVWAPWAAGGAGLVVLLIIAVLLLRRRGSSTPGPVLRPGARVAELEAEANALRPAPSAALPALEPLRALLDPGLAFRDQARELAKADPVRAANLIRAWVIPDSRETKNA